MKAPKKYTAKYLNQVVAIGVLAMAATFGIGLYVGLDSGYRDGYVTMGYECVSILTKLRDNK